MVFGIFYCFYILCCLILRGNYFGKRMVRVHALELENMLLHDQLRCAMAIAFGVPYDKTEDLIR